MIDRPDYSHEYADRGVTLLEERPLDPSLDSH